MNMQSGEGCVREVGWRNADVMLSSRDGCELPGLLCSALQHRVPAAVR